MLKSNLKPNSLFNCFAFVDIILGFSEKRDSNLRAKLELDLRAKLVQDVSKAWIRILVRSKEATYVVEFILRNNNFMNRESTLTSFGTLWGFFQYIQ